MTEPQFVEIVAHAVGMFGFGVGIIFWWLFLREF